MLLLLLKVAQLGIINTCGEKSELKIDGMSGAGLTEMLYCLDLPLVCNFKIHHLYYIFIYILAEVQAAIG